LKTLGRSKRNPKQKTSCRCHDLCR
jgi:hypothetical protein